MAEVSPPTMKQEQYCWSQGESVVVGVDEVGKGAWAGPLTVGAVVLPRSGRVKGIRDSKMLTSGRREKSSTTKLGNGLKIGLLAMLLLENATSWACLMRNGLLLAEHLKC